ncbi:hypothetical protein [Nitrosopumilus sp.]|uniref:hypothetical protein n=1 Tax=Nitrosopumilus sp. TaxID=2024843 RepID=UPI003D13D9D2
MTNLIKFMVNGLESNLLSAKTRRNGSRTVDSMEFSIPPKYSIDEGDEVTYIQDVADTTFLTAIYNFQHSARDEGGYDLDGDDGTYTADYANDTSRNYAKSVKPVIRFNADNEKVTVSDNSRFDFSKQFDIIVVVTPEVGSSTARTFFSKSNGGVGGGIEIGISGADPGYVDVELFSTAGILTQITGTNVDLRDGDYHFVRVKRDENDLITVSVDGTSEGTATKSAAVDDYTASGVDLLIGKNFGAGSKHFRGNIAQLRIYSGGYLKDSDFTKVLNAKRQPLTMKFRGKVSHYEDNVGVKTVYAQSDTEVAINTKISKSNMDSRDDSSDNNGIDNIFLDDATNRMRTDTIVEKILEQIDSEFIFVNDTSNGTIMNRYVARGTLISIISNLFALDSRSFWITPRKVLIKENSPISTTHSLLSQDYNMNVDGKDTTLLINDLEAVGEVQVHNRTELFSGNGSLTAFSLSDMPITTKVSVGGTEQIRGIDSSDSAGNDYYIEYTDGSSSGAQIIFYSAPASGSNNISVEYTFENTSTLYFRNSDATSITNNGRISGRIYLPGFDQNQLASLVSSIVTDRKTIKRRIVVQAPKLINFVREGLEMDIVYPLKSIDSAFELKSIEWIYPDGITILTFGEHKFDYFDIMETNTDRLVGLDDSIVKANNI